jgi:glycosyltransferase involved in cell wall biosynthesis
MNDLVAVSHALAERCERLHWKRHPKVIRNGLPDLLRSVKEAFPLRVGFLASHSLWKGTAFLPKIITATEELPLSWNLFGQPSEETQPTINRLEKMPRVHFFGQRPPHEIFSQIDLLLHLSQEFDPYPTVLLEAARAGIPAIASRIGGVDEIVVHGATGLLFTPGDISMAIAALKQLATDPHLRRDLSLAARARFEQKFRIEQMVADYTTFWNRLRSLSQ